MKLRNKKTGEIVEAWSFYYGDNSISIKYFTDDGQTNLEYYSLNELNEEWEDYKPAEPLIKDEKVRKAVRAWAEANGAWLLVVVSSYRIGISQVDAEMLFNDPVFKDLPSDRQLTIEELCGEEEE